MEKMENFFNKKENIEDKFSESKVRDKDGKLLEVYHFSDSKINKFSTDFVGKNIENDKGFFGAGIYFTETNDAYHYGENRHSAYLNLKNPLIIENPTLEDIKNLHGKKQEILDQGYDGVMVWNDGSEGETKDTGKMKISTKSSPAQWTELVVFDPKNIHITNNEIK